MGEEFRSFYDRPVWKQLRYRVLRRYGFQCMACGQKRDEEHKIHVDHIKPVSIYPELALVEDNLQVLCADCNYGKSNRYSDDLRPRAVESPPPMRWVPRDAEEARVMRFTRIGQALKERVRQAERAKNTADLAKYMRLYLQIQKGLKAFDGDAEASDALAKQCEEELGLTSEATA